MFIFFLFLMAMIGALYFFCWLVYRDIIAHWPQIFTRHRKVLGLVITTLPTLFILSIFTVRTDTSALINGVYVVSGQMLQILLILTAIACIHFVLSRFIKHRLLYRIIFSFGVLVYMYSVWAGLYLAKTYITVSSSNIMEQTKIAFIADIHLGPVWGSKDFVKVLNEISVHDPDVLLIAGDLFDGTDVRFEEIANTLKETTQKYPVYFVTGNHEYYGAKADFIKTLETAGVFIIDDIKSTFKDIDLIGIGYGGDTASRTQAAVTKDRLLRIGSTPPERFTIAMKHVPDYTDVMLEVLEPDLMLFGHSHGGQQFPFSLIAQMQYGPFASGLIQTESGYSYTTSGAGSWGPFNRILTKREVVLITLEPASR